MPIQELKKKAALVRKLCLTSTSEAGSGHPTSCLSATDLTTVLFEKYFSYDLKNPHNLNNDRLIFSKGHAAPLLYTLFALSGGLPIEELNTLRKFGSRLEGHPTHFFPFAEAATGSLGQGLSIGAGIALSGKKDKRIFKTYVILGDGELAEGSAWEAANFASYYSLKNLIAIVDVNRLGQSQETMFGHKVKQYVDRFSAFGWEVKEIDGHNLEEIIKAFDLALNNKSEKPFVIIAKTKKGKGISFLEDKDGWHGKPLNKEDLEKALKELGKVDDKLRFVLKSPPVTSSIAPALQTKIPRLLSSVSKEQSQEAATREVYGQVLAKLGDINPLIYSLDGDTKNSTYSEIFKNAHPDRFIECFIAEQNMAGVAVGLSRTGKIPFVSTFAAFLTRAFDQIRMAVISKSNIKFVGSHAGVSIGEDGASQMGLEDFAMFGVLPESVVIHPCDAISTTKLLPLLVNHVGISYFRTLRPKTRVVYKSNDEFNIGGSKTLRSSENDILTVAACGITVFEALKAYEELKKGGINIKVIDCYSIKPIDKKTLLKCLAETEIKTIVTVEDHFEHGGMGDFVLSALSNSGAKVEKLAVAQISRSGKKDELLAYAGIDAKHIAEKVKKIVNEVKRTQNQISDKQNNVSKIVEEL
ncbi:transketolase [Candidatus Microgenomates bacterium]|nr:MAG: transketolase [Candidatus Microgenomates bacterium]